MANNSVVAIAREAIARYILGPIRLGEGGVYKESEKELKNKYF